MYEPWPAHADIRDAWGAECYLCGEAVPQELWSRDHIVPHALGGPDIISNRRLTHSRCDNSKKMCLLPDLANTPHLKKRGDELRGVWEQALLAGWHHYKSGNAGRKMPWLYATWRKARDGA